MRNKRISNDSFSDDDVPLKVIKINGYTKDPNSYDSLRQNSIEPCEFCDRISKNRYSSLIHNVRHIIIPLLNQTVIQCKICLHHFTSEEDLRTHHIKKHNLIIIPQTNIVKQNNELSHNQLTLSQSTAGNRNIPISTNKLQTQEFICTNSNEPELKNCVKKNEPNVSSMKNRLIFEDDDVIFLDCDQLLNDLTTDCKVNLEVFKTPWLVDDEFSGRSVHYDELVKPGVYRCKRCGKGFPRRYDAIIHETSHLTIKDSQVTLCIICKQYMVGDRSHLRLHYLTHHKEKCEKHTQTYPRYHEPEYITNRKINIDEEKTRILEEKIDVSVEKRTFDSKIDVSQEKRTFDSKIYVTKEKITYDSKILFVCDLCFSFCKNKSSTSYEYVRTISEIGKRYHCEKCGMKFFEINIVKRHVRRRMCTNNKKKHTTKEERLKIIANRFKMLKKY